MRLDSLRPVDGLGPLTPALSPSEGERVPFRAGKGEWQITPGHELAASVSSQRQSQPGDLSPVPAERFQVRPGVAQHAIALAQEIATFGEGFV